MRHTIWTGALTCLLAVGFWGGTSTAQQPQPGEQAATSPDAPAPEGEVALGSVRLPRAVLANGERLAAGTYRVRLTPQTAGPEAKGAQPSLERWVEFLQGNEVKGREISSIVPAAEIKTVATSSPPSRGGYKVEMLKGDDYMRVWIHRGDFHYLIHMPPAG